MGNDIEYPNRKKAGEILADELSKLKLKNPVLFAIPRGGIQIAEGVADKFKVPIHPLVVKKLPIPGSPETALGAISSEGVRVFDEETIRLLTLTESDIQEISLAVINEINTRLDDYGRFNFEIIKGADVILVDDGIATGYSVIAAIKTLKKHNPNSITLGVPVSAESAYIKISPMVTHFVCPIISDSYFFAVGSYYSDFKNQNPEQIKRTLDHYESIYGKEKS